MPCLPSAAAYRTVIDGYNRSCLLHLICDCRRPPQIITEIQMMLLQWHQPDRFSWQLIDRLHSVIKLTVLPKLRSLQQPQMLLTLKSELDSLIARSNFFRHRQLRQLTNNNVKGNLDNLSANSLSSTTSSVSSMLGEP